MSESTPAPNSAVSGRGAVVALAAVIGPGFVLHAGRWSFLCDDAYISFRYARNLAEHGLLTFNVSPPEYVEGYTNFLWVLLLALGHLCGVEPPVFASILDWLAAGAGLVLTTLLARDLRGGERVEWTDLAAPALLVAWPEYMVWSSGGLAGSAALCLVLGACLAFNRGRLVMAAAFTAAAYLTRPDALLPIAGYGLGWLGWQGWSRGRAGLASIPWRRVGVALAVFLVPVLIHLAWRRAYYGSWVPNTWAVKAHGRLLRDTWGVAYLVAWSSGLQVVALAPALAAVRGRSMPALVGMAFVLVYAWWVGGDFMAYGRFLIVATALAATVAAVGLASLVALVRPRAGARAGLAVGAATLLVVVGWSAWRADVRWRADMAKSTGRLDGRWEGVAIMDRFARVRVAAGKAFRGRVPPETLVTVGAAGAMPYTSGLQTMDAFGLIDPAVPGQPGIKPATGERARPGHQLYAPTALIKSRDPDLLCHVGHVAQRRPGPRQAVPAFRRGYTWACVEYDPILDDRDPDGTLDPGGFYCCRRPLDRAVGSFGAEAGP